MNLTTKSLLAAFALHRGRALLELARRGYAAEQIEAKLAKARRKGLIDDDHQLTAAGRELLWRHWS